VKKQQLDHVLRAAGAIIGAEQFIIIGSQALHGKYPDLPDEIVRSIEVDLIAKDERERTEWLAAIGVDSPFHEQFGYYADPVDESTAVLPKGWKGRLVNLPGGDTGKVRALCLDPHDLAISKYVAGREKDIDFTRQLAQRGLVDKRKLLALFKVTAVSAETKERVLRFIEADFEPQAAPSSKRSNP
jgi:hypothetical protein